MDHTTAKLRSVADAIKCVGLFENDLALWRGGDEEFGASNAQIRLAAQLRLHPFIVG